MLLWIRRVALIAFLIDPQRMDVHGWVASVFTLYSVCDLAVVYEFPSEGIRDVG